jgi:hypothetical protein
MAREDTFSDDDETWEELGEALERGEPIETNPPVTEWQWRVGTSYGIHVYALHPTAERDEKGRSDFDVPVLSALGSPSAASDVAAHIVYAHNRLLRSFDDSRHDALTSVTLQEVSLTDAQEFGKEVHGISREDS